MARVSNAQKAQKRTSENKEELYSGKTTTGSSASHALTSPIPIIYPNRKKVKVYEPDNQLDTFAALVQRAIETDNKLLDIVKEHPVVNLPELGQNKL